MEEKKETKYIDMSAHLEVDVSELFGIKKKDDEASDKGAFSDERGGKE